ncbi:type 2 lanthipeptide synthetase LanM family protein [Nocardiopsis mangrovi]|uniref:Type 2 lanthipeptide synthetase LanM family protein n=1 Tax=Nocardiopsis mangrovi TaxID=1179818 RepID=A0ABV9DRZ9_9ACTN
MGNAYPVDLAARACNLSERMRVADALGALGPAEGYDGLHPADTWKIDRVAGKLALKSARAARNGGGPAAHAKDRLVDVLTAHRLRELALDRAPDDPAQATARKLLTETHRAWLPTYRSALDRFAEAAGEPDADWRRADTYYGRLAIACEPFLLELGRLLREAVHRPAPPGSARISPQVVADFQHHLLDRFELALAWAVEADAKVYCARTGADPATASRDDYRRYLDHTFRDPAAYHDFYRRFPVLGRWLAQVTRLLADFGRDLVGHLAADSAAIADAFFDRGVTAVRSLRLGNSDHHAGARSVAFIEVELDGGASGTVVYKPRCIRSEAAMQTLLRRLSDDGVIAFAGRAVLPRDGYGYEAHIPAGRNRVEARADVEHVYRQLGGYLGIFYVLGGGDLHFENVIVADGDAFVCDCETVLGVRPAGQPDKEGSLLDSVFGTGLLEWPNSAARDGDPAVMHISGYTGGTSYEIPIAVPRVTGDRLTFRSAVTHVSGVEIRPGAANRVFLGDELMQPGDFTDAIADGFRRVYAWFQDDPESSAACVAGAFADASVRFINRSTQVYAQSLLSARHPKALADPLEVDLLTSAVRTHPRAWDDGGVLVERELDSLWRLDIPIFTVATGDLGLTHDHGSAIPSYLALSPIDHITRRIGRLSDANLTRQRHYITASLSTGEITAPSFAAACLDQAAQVGERLCDMLREPAAPAPWTSFDLRDGHTVEADVEGDLYHGSAGIGLFLAYLDSLVPRPAFRHAARRALGHAAAAPDTGRIGAFQGTGGLIYLLTHLSRLWDDPALLDHAVRLADGLRPRIGDDRRLDILDGAAGLVPVLLGLADATGGHGLDAARMCGDHLLRTARAGSGTLSWPQPDGDGTPHLTGFTHGTAGFGWSLISLGARLDRTDYTDAGRRAFGHEARFFDDAERDWYDLRTSGGGVARNGRHYANAWCNGAAGIGLSRIAAWSALGRDDDSLMHDARLALSATMRNFPRLRNDTLCHGRSGNAELLLRFALLNDEPAFRMEANVQVQTQWRNLDESRSGGTGASTDFFPGLLLGISGMGMHLLRLAHPERVPSVLLLDPPPAATDQR